MDEPRPKIFISTVTKELAKARGKVADTLRLLHFQPVIQEEFPSHTGVVREMLEKELAPCAAVIQIVGHRYGWEVHGAADPTEVMSYTHYEAQYAHRKPIPIWYLIISDDYLVDHPNDEDETKKLFQTAYRARLQRTGYLYHRVEDIKDVELTVFRMQQDLDLLRPPRFQQLPLLNSGNGHAETPPAPAAAPVASPAEMEKLMRQVLSDLVPALQQAKPNTSPEGDAAEEEKLYSRLASILGKTPDEARAEIAALAKKTKADTSEPLLERAKAAYALKDYATAEKLALQAAAENPTDALAALCQAGEAAAEQIHYKRALDHFRAAASLTSEKTNVLQWADIQNEIGWLLYLDGQYDAQADLMHRVWQACEKAGYADDSRTLRAHLFWANALDFQGRHAEAEREHRAVLAILERVHGPEHPDALACRNNLASALNSQGKHAEAEREHRSVLAIEERVLGSEHPDTLASRNNLAGALKFQGKHAEVEREHRAVLAIKERVLGEVHPATLGSRMNLANALYSLGKHAEAEREHRAVLAIRERVLGPEHPDTLMSRSNLAAALYSQGKHAETESEERAVLAIQERVLGPEHPNTLRSCFNLSLTLEDLGRKGESLGFASRALAGWNKLLGENHPDTQDAKRWVEQLEGK